MVRKFRINISPVSGRYFCNQVALKCNFNDAIRIICEILNKSPSDFKPDMAFSSSGGNVSEYMDMAANYDSERLIYITKMLNSEMFIKSWIPGGLEFIPNWVIGISKNSLFRKGYGPHYMFNILFDNGTIKRTEIITGTYDVENCRSQCFSNMSYSESYINANIYNLDKHIYDCLPIEFLDGDIYEIANASFASACVPLVTENHKVKNKYYSDGGVTYDSPIAAFKFEIIRIIQGKNFVLPKKQKETKETKEQKETKETKELNKTYILCDDDVLECNDESSKPKALRMTYFACYQIDTHHDSCGPNVKNQFTEIFRQQRHILAIHDKNAALDIFYHAIGDQNKIRNENIFNMTTKELAKKLEFLETKMHYLIILYPHGYVHIKENNFNGEDILKYVDITRKNFGADIYYSDDDI